MSGTDDEIFDESEGAEKVLAQGQVDRVSDALYMSGFRQGLSDGQESERTLQDSFDSGYRASFQVFKEIGTVRAALAVALATLEGQDARSDDEKLIQDLYVKVCKETCLLTEIYLHIDRFPGYENTRKDVQRHGQREQIRRRGELERVQD
jgi:hypothetical protein